MSSKTDEMNDRYSKRRNDIQALMSKTSNRKIYVNKLVTILTICCVIFAIIPLGSILFEVFKNGYSAIDLEFLTQKPGSILSSKGGIGPAIQGTLIVVALGSLIAIPVGVLAGIYLSEYAKSNSKFAFAVRFFSDVLTGLPSIIVGIVGYVLIVLAIGSFSVIAGAFSLSLIMIPIVTRITEETLKIVPNSIREGAHSLGIPKWKITLFIVIRTAISGILTGIVLSIARIAGETAPLIMTILGTSLFFSSFTAPVDALPLRIWRLASQPYEAAHANGWGAALILILIILGLNISLRLISQRKSMGSSKNI
ncbi:MAG TPA: phosphate ABC transporter permease PstA [Nitrososphaeraceae archaeon]|nr:phosphate ABC transporter permease PstA [Nitrososphaeraceae archaeon]